MDNKRPIWHCWRLIAITLLALVSLPGQGSAAPSSGPAQLVKAIRISTDDSSPTGLTAVGNRVYFFTREGTETAVLWSSDGTSSGTFSLAEQANSVLLLTNVGGVLFFVKGGGLWKTNGTLSGTSLVRQFDPDLSIFLFSKIFTLKGTLFFEAKENNSLSLWKSDGTPAGTQRVVSSWPGIISSPITVDDTIFFISPNSVFGTFDLWKSDGTAAGTQPVFQQIQPLSGTNARGPTMAPPIPGPPTASLVDIDGTLFFSIRDDITAFGLWKSDGTTAGTIKVKDIAPTLMTVVGKVLFFSVLDYGSGSDPTHGPELWKSDGTTAGTVLVKDIVPGPSGSDPNNFTDVNGTLFFSALDASGGRDLWKSNGTAGGTVSVKDFFPGLGRIWNLNGKLFLIADDGLHGFELWKSDGTTAGTVLVKDIYPGPGSVTLTWMVNANGTLFFSARDHDHGHELWRTDGSAAGTILVKDINTQPRQVFTSRRLTDLNGTLFFWADDGHRGTELWRTDGTAAGTTMLKNVDVVPYDQVITLDDALFFVSGWQLWRSDGTAAGTAPFAGGLYDLVRGVFNVNGTLFFFGKGWLWKSDGTPAGTTQVKEENGIQPSDTVAVNETLFYADNWELWRSDGTAAGTIRLRDGFSDIGQMTDVNGTLFFMAIDDAHGAELWKSDGTVAGTTMVRDILSGPDSSLPAELTNINGTLFFVANDGQLGAELWRSNGTASGTVRVADITSGPASSDITELTNVNGTLFFARSQQNGQLSHELWKSDGTTNGTARVTPLSQAGPPKELFAFNELLLFTAVNANGYRALWRSDGTAQGTRSIQDIMPESQPYAPIYPTVSGSSIYFNVYTSALARELWSIPISAGVDTSVRAPTLLRGAPGGEMDIPIVYLNAGRTVAQGTTVSATLDPRLTYVGDTSGIVPTVSGTTLTWRLPDAGLLDGRDFRLRVRLPRGPLGTHYPITLRVTTAATDARPANNVLTADIVAADLRYVPIVLR
jgi:ELWxxDGT repeat protein